MSAPSHTGWADHRLTTLPNQVWTNSLSAGRGPRPAGSPPRRPWFNDASSSISSVVVSSAAVCGEPTPRLGRRIARRSPTAGGSRPPRPRSSRPGPFRHRAEGSPASAGRSRHPRAAAAASSAFLSVQTARSRPDHASDTARRTVSWTCSGCRTGLTRGEVSRTVVDRWSEPSQVPLPRQSWRHRRWRRARWTQAMTSRLIPASSGS